MKIKYMAGVFTAFMLLSLAFFYQQTAKEEYSPPDMISYNEKMKQIELALQNGDGREKIEEQYLCRLLFLQDPDYKSRLNQYQKKGALILDYYEEGQIFGKAVWETDSRNYQKLREKLKIDGVLLWGILLAAGYGLLAAIYAFFIRPFGKLQRFAGEIAKGNLELSLPMHKNNFFGAFTESFDMMREELKRARENEYQANISKKELVAELSHDIKTPVATIQAACEIMQVKVKDADILEKTGVIAQKARMIDRLVQNLFHATLEELEVLKVEAEEESSLCVLEMLKEVQCYEEIRFENEIPQCLICVDKLRFHQIIDNIANNAYKYAKTPLWVSFQDTGEGIQVILKDQGPGVSEEEIGMVMEKYYRGSNTKGISGSGLGLYLAQNFMKRMKGSVECRNENGFVVVLFLRRAGRGMAGDSVSNAG